MSRKQENKRQWFAYEKGTPLFVGDRLKVTHGGERYQGKVINRSRIPTTKIVRVDVVLENGTVESYIEGSDNRINNIAMYRNSKPSKMISRSAYLDTVDRLDRLDREEVERAARLAKE